MQCPGQDRRYWGADAAVEVPCPECGVAVEIFKDENAGRCPRCGHRFVNAGGNFGCAQWCALAKECLGFVPERQAQPGSGESALAARLIQWIEQALAQDPPRLGHALRVFQHAKNLVQDEGGDPRVVLSAALLLSVDPRGQDSAQIEAQSGCSAAHLSADEVLLRLGLDETTRARVVRIIDAYRQNADDDAIEPRIVRDAHALAGLAAERYDGDLAQLEALIEANLHTEAAKRRARSILQR
jgi:hypothetical protein